ncbi:MAG: stage III sporulation AC/AD family protein [Clostridiales bacterium]|nr:stage III sporulation AC/AD family protein [Clostridiales bacterium]
MTIVTISIAGITAVLLAVQMKGLKAEYGAYISLAAGCLIFFYGIAKLKIVIDALRQLEEMISINHVYLETLLKMTGITFIAEFASGICRDSGYGFVGTQIEVFAKLSILAVSMPIVLALMETLKEFLK